MTSAIAIGLDIGTSGVRCAAVDAAGTVLATAKVSYAEAAADPRDPAAWARLSDHALDSLLAAIDASAVRALAVDGTSGTLLAIDMHGRPVAPPMLYSDAVDDPALFDSIGRAAPTDSPALSASSGLAKALRLQASPGIAHIVHQADWIAARWSGRWDATDENNALKTGYDVVARHWPEWLAETGLRDGLLPSVVPPGTPIGPITAVAARRHNLAPGTIVAAGTTDGCASFLATGAARIGEGVTALGSSLTVKLVCHEPIFAARYGIYSHRLGDLWLAGGASNTGGKVLAAFFDGAELDALSARIDPDRAAVLDYYPLLRPGERFPISDPDLPPRLAPRPAGDADFLLEMLAGIARIEQQGYDQLRRLGGPSLRSVRTVGGGASNPTWSAIRRRALGVREVTPRSLEAAAGTALLALQSLSGRSMT